jgi:hypothetical protein
VNVDVRGSFLDGAYGVWFDDHSLSGRLLKLEEVKEQIFEKPNPLKDKSEKSPTIYRAQVEVAIPLAASLQVHSLRLVTPKGATDVLPFRVSDEPSVLETVNPHETVQEAQTITFPAIINGKLGRPGEIDYYSFRAKQGQEVFFDILQAENCEPRLALYRPGGSWVDPNRPSPLLMREESSDFIMPRYGRRTYRVLRDGQYLLQVSSLFGKGTPDSVYQVRAASGVPAGTSFPDMEQFPGEWPERSFSRKLEEGWITNLETRAVDAGNNLVLQAKAASLDQASSVDARSDAKPKPMVKALVHLGSEVDREPNDLVVQAQKISIPCLIEGAIERPGDVDSFKFKVEAGEKLAFEIETPDMKPPYFNPRIGIVDSQDHELLSNVERRVSMFNNNAERVVYLMDVESKAIHTFERGGEYVLQIRDMTSRYGGSGYRYKILVRPEIPHVGTMALATGDAPLSRKGARIDSLNLVRGVPKALTVVASYEEGFTGDLSFTFIGLPNGVQAYPAMQFNDNAAPTEMIENSDTLAPKRQRTAIVLLASDEAQLTQEPVMVRLLCRPIAHSKLGPTLSVQKLPLTVVESSQPKKEVRAQ